MAEISDLTAASALTGAELLHVVQGGNSRQAIAFEISQSGLSVIASQTTPPGSPATGYAYIVTATATDAWAGQEGDVAIYDGSAWDFLTPVEGWRVWDQGDDSLKYFDGSAWAEFSGGGGSVSIEDDGSEIVATAATLNFTGAGVTVTDAGSGQANIAIPASGNGQFTQILTVQAGTITTGTAKVTFRMPYAVTLEEVRASVSSAPTGSAISIGINEGGTSILSTDLTIDAGETTSTTAATAAVISDTDLADDAEITIDIDAVGSSTAGDDLIVTLIGTAATVPGTYTDTLAISAAASGSWSIPAGCTAVNFRGVLASASGAGVINVSLSPAVSSSGMNVEIIAAAANTFFSLVTGQFGALAMSSSADNLLIEGEVLAPRDSAIKTAASSRIASANRNAVRDTSFLASVASDHDTVTIASTGGALTGELQITYTIG